MPVSRLKHITPIGVEQMGALADGLSDTEILHMETSILCGVDQPSATGRRRPSLCAAYPLRCWRAVQKSLTLLIRFNVECMFKSLSPKTRRNIARIAPFGVIWFVFNQIFNLSEYAMLGGVESLSATTAIQVDFSIFLFANAAVITIGLLVGTIELVFINKRFAKRSLSQKIVGKILFYSIFMLVVVVITYSIAASMELNTHPFNGQVANRLSNFMGSNIFLGTLVQLSTTLGVSLFYAEISEHIGHGVLLNFFTGKYHKPKEEVRIFMFSDMKSSTQIAEQLGHVRYFELLKAYYNDIADGIVSYGGEIYQYVGDEVVVSWTLENGLENRNCIQSFRAMKSGLRKKADWYQDQFGVVPDFKSGLHVGSVTTGEIGALRKEIVFTGDVLNATARIQGLCNQYGVDLLLSGNLVSHLELNDTSRVRSIGECELRGKTQRVELFTLK